jgi:hypothetical protein
MARPHDERAEIDLVPLKLFSQRIAEGWTMVPGYPLQPGDFAVTMSPPGWPVPRSNLSRAAQHRNVNAARERAERARMRLLGA